MSNQKVLNVIKPSKNKITKTSYDKILKNVNAWPQWKKNLCNQELLVSVRAKKI